MHTRRFVMGAAGLLIAGRAWARTQPTVSFPRELGLPPLPVPQSLSNETNLFPVPSGYFIRAFCQSNCQDTNVSREAKIEQWQSDGSSLLQKISAFYNGNPDNAGISATRLFAPFDTTTWIVINYTHPDLQSGGYNISPDLGVIKYDAVYHQGEGVFRIAYSQDQQRLDN